LSSEAVDRHLPPQMIKGAAEIVDGVSDEQSPVVRELRE
jgi:hypothetical protein